MQKCLMLPYCCGPMLTNMLWSSSAYNQKGWGCGGDWTVRAFFFPLHKCTEVNFSSWKQSNHFILFHYCDLLAFLGMLLLLYCVLWVARRLLCIRWKSRCKHQLNISKLCHVQAHLYVTPHKRPICLFYFQRNIIFLECSVLKMPIFHLCVYIKILCLYRLTILEYQTHLTTTLHDISRYKVIFQA